MKKRCSQIVRLLDKGVSELLDEHVPLLRSFGRYRDSDEDSSDILYDYIGRQPLYH
jgi:hypothetical protein